LALLATITLKVVPFHAYASFLALLPFFKGSLEIMFRETEKNMMDEAMTVIVFGQKCPGEKGSVKHSVILIQQPLLLLPKFGAKSLHIFMQSP
jgi:hypothetical protein